VSYLLDGLRERGSLNVGVDLENGGRLRILMNDVNGDGQCAGSRILAHAPALRDAEPEVPVILVPKDINLRHVTPEQIAQFKSERAIEPEDDHEFDLGEYCTLINEHNSKQTLLAKVDVERRNLIPILDYHEGVWGIRPRNREQHFALDALLDDRIKLVTLMGKELGFLPAVPFLAEESALAPQECVV
tara:strand:- start:202 stop:765 length:564 start_codon:yes stop_codon:yes gene_type:complete